jgi:arginine N-succinyltransferase
MLRYEIRAALLADEAELHALAHYLNTVNLPDDRDAIREILELSQHSFDGTISDPRRREFVFVLRDLQRNQAVATSMIIAQLGRRGSPYIYLDVDREEKYSATLDKHFVHPVLCVRYSYNGPTEIGGLVVHPDYRSGPDKLGTLISFVRFLFIAIHRHDFRDEVLAELLPPLEPDGTSHLWEALGRHFTGLSYLEADKLSKRNKEFIRGLFPEGEIYATLLSPKAQAVIGAVGEQTRGVEKMLTRIGFRYAERIDPFDGGPHFIARTDEVSLVRAAHPAELVQGPEGGKGSTPVLIAKTLSGPPYFTAIPTTATAVGEGAWAVSESLLRHFEGVGAGDIWVLPTATPENVTPLRNRS